MAPGARMKRPSLTLMMVAFVATLAAGCATGPTHPTLRKASLPELIPLRKFFLDVETNYDYKVSPDGKRLAWLAVDNRRLTIHLKEIGGDRVTVIDTRSPRSVFWFAWARDSRRILYSQDHDGDENHHIYLVDTASPQERPVDLTPFPGTRAFIQRIIRSDPDHVLIAHNHRDKTVFDLYRVNLTSHAQTPIAQNPGDVISWVTDRDGSLRARFRQINPTETRLELLDPDAGTWSSLLTLGLEDVVHVLGFTLDNKAMWLRSNLGQDRIGLVRLDLQTRQEVLVYQDPRVDVDRVVVSERTWEPLLAVTYPDHQQVHFFDPGLETDLGSFKKSGPTGLAVLSFDHAERVLTAHVWTDRGSEWFLVNRVTGEKVFLGRSPIADHAASLATVQPVAFKSRDGFLLHGYLTLPPGAPGRHLPVVLLVHGGPWWRDYWGYNSTVQFLANRGYAVLQVNYRGSTGYGRAFREAAVGEFAGKMHDDLIDGVQWAIDKGIGDPQRICIYGASYGGYATLVGLTFTPDVFACGVDIVGMSNLVTLLELAPPYWKLSLPYWYKYVGDPRRPEDRRRMEARSPLFRADQVKRPLLIIHGANDARVKQQESDQMVGALRKAGKEVEYVVFPDEGHRSPYGNWKNILNRQKRIEDFLAGHLGGRSAGFDYYELGFLVY